MALERLYLPGMLLESEQTVGLFQKPDGSSWVRDTDMVETRLPTAGGGGAPVNAQYLTLAADATLTAERILTAGQAVSLTDGGAGGPLTVDVEVDGVTIGVNGFNELTVLGGAGAPANAQYVVMALDAGLSAERVLTAGDAIGLTDGGANGPATLDVLYDGVSIGLNGSNQLEVIGGALANAVIKAPGSSTRNLITPTGDFVALPIIGIAGQTASMFTVAENGVGTPFFRLVPDGGTGGAVGIGAGTYDPANYGGFTTRFVVQNGSVIGAVVGGQNIAPASGTAWQSFFDALFEPTGTTTLIGGMQNIYGYIGTQSTTDYVGQWIYHRMAGTKTAGSGNQIVASTALRVQNEIDAFSTGDVETVNGIYTLVAKTGTGTTSAVIGHNIDTRFGNSAVTLPELIGIDVNAWSYALTTAVTNAYGVRINDVGRRNSVATSYALYITDQTTQAPLTPADTWSIYSAGGKSRLDAGLATVIPLTLRGAAAQTENLQIWENSAGADLLGVTASGALDFVEQATPAAPAANVTRMFSRDNGTGRTQICVEFASGRVIVIAEDSGDAPLAGDLLYRSVVLS